MIANDVVEKLQNSEIFETIEAVNPGFINIKISKNYLAGGSKSNERINRL